MRNSTGLKFLIFFLGLLYPFQSIVAQTGQLKGTVVDANTLKPLPFANIFVNRTTVGTSSNEKGEYALKNIPIGSSEIIFSFLGYQSFTAHVTLRNKQTLELEVKLQPEVKELGGMEITAHRDTGWEKKMRKFEKVFLGEGLPATQCKIINRYVIEFPKDDSKGITATADKPIEIENRYLGYKIYFYLKNFHSDVKGYSIVGNTQFEELRTADPSIAFQWTRNRERAFQGSPRHLFKSLIAKRSRTEGFQLYTDKLNQMTVRSNGFYYELERTIIRYDTENMVAPGTQSNEYKILVKGRLEIHYINKDAQKRYYRDIPYPVSWMEVKGAVVHVNHEGIILNPTEVVISGNMTLSRVSEMLPANYQLDEVVSFQSPQVTINTKRLMEKVFISTDKPYYYPGEVIWWKACMNYRLPEMRDSLSKVLYVELINPKKMIVRSSIIKIDSGFAKGDFLLPDTLPRGNYSLRAYTSWMRNYGTGQFCVMQFPVINAIERVDPAEGAVEAPCSRLLAIQSDKESYGPREPVQLHFQTKDNEGQPVAAHLSVAVTDAFQVVTLAPRYTLEKDFAMDDGLPKGMHSKFEFPMEGGISFSGRFLNNRGKPESASLTVFQASLNDLIVLQTSEKGEFFINNQEIEDSVQYAFQVLNTNGKPFGKVVVRKREVPPLDFQVADFSVKILETATPKHVITDYEATKDAIVLNEVQIKGKSIENQVNDRRYDRPYGEPYLILKGEDLAKYGSSLTTSLSGRIPGFLIYNKDNHYYITRARALDTSMTYNTVSEPFVMVDNVQVVLPHDQGETVGDRLMMMSPSMIDRVEVISMAGSMIGANGSNGVLAIYTKKYAPSPDYRSLTIATIKGFTPTRDFKSPDYSSPALDSTLRDERSTIYWNPQVKTGTTGSASVSFFTADYPGKYRVVAEGITANGEVVRCEYFFEVR